MPRVAQGGTTTLRGNVGRSNGYPADAPDLTLTIVDETGGEVGGFPVAIPPIVRDDLGRYHYVWAVPSDLPIGDFTATWEGTVDDASAGGSETVEVVEPGAVDQPYLTVAQFREHVGTSLVDDALQLLLDAAEQAIVARYGAPGTITDLRLGGGGMVALSRRAGNITKVEELFILGSSVVDQDLRQTLYAQELWAGSTELATDDYLLDASGYVLQRVADGTNPAEVWAQGVRITYVAFDDTAERKRVQMQLVKLDLDFSPGLTGQTIGTWSESYAPPGNYAAQREDILGSLADVGLGFA